MSRDLYIVFDGPPGAEAGRFVEVENAWGEGMASDPANWTEREDGRWMLGPFRPVEPTDGVRASRGDLITVRGDLGRLTTDLVNDAIGDIQRGAPRLRRRYFGLKDYAQFRGQREDHEYGMGPGHGSTVVAIELAREARQRDLTVEEMVTATSFLIGLEVTA